MALTGWEPGFYPSGPRVNLDLADLPERYDVLNFRASPSIEPSFVLHDRQMTKDAAEKVALMYQSLVDGVAAPPQDIQRFVMQSVWCMFAGDLKMLTSWPFERSVDQLLKAADPSNAMDEGAYADLKALHKEVDEAIADCYGWPKSVAQDDKELVVQLTELNRQIVEGERAYSPFEA